MPKAETPEQRERAKELREAEKRYVAELKDAEKGLKTAERDFEKRVSAAEKELKRVKNPPPLGKYQAITVREDLIETGKGSISLLEGPVKAEVEATGNVAVDKKDKKTDTRELYLKISGPSRTHVEKCNPNDGDKVRQLAATIENASRGAAKQKELRASGISEAEAALQEARADRSEIEAAATHLAEVRAQKGTMDEKRSELGLDPLPETYHTTARRRKRILLWTAAGILGLVALIGAVAALGGGSDKGSEEGAANPPAQSAPPPPAEPAPEPVPEDTGRMSEGEFEEFRNAQQEVAEESQQFADGAQKCAVIGQTGDLPEFSRCIDDAWSGFTSKAQYAYFIAGEQMSNTAKQCQTALRSYRTVLANYQATLDVAHKYASNLQIDLMGAAFNRVPAATRRYVKFALNAVAACEPT